MKAFILLVIVAAAFAEPEAEADPQLLLAGAYYGHYYPYAYYTLGKSAPCVNAANQPVPCAAYNGYAKREAEPEADPAYFAVGGYPYHPYAYGLVHTSHFGVCTNYLGKQVPC